MAAYTHTHIHTKIILYTYLVQIFNQDTYGCVTNNLVSCTYMYMALIDTEDGTLINISI